MFPELGIKTSVSAGVENGLETVTRFQAFFFLHPWNQQDIPSPTCHVARADFPGERSLTAIRCSEKKKKSYCFGIMHPVLVRDMMCNCCWLCRAVWEHESAPFRNSYLFIYLINAYVSGVSVEEEGGERGIPFLAARCAFVYSNLYLSFAIQSRSKELDVGEIGRTVTRRDEQIFIYILLIFMINMLLILLLACSYVMLCIVWNA